jgi:hypothetical protein
MASLLGLRKFAATLERFSPARLVSRHIALPHWRTTDAALACFNLYRSASRIEAQNAAAFRLLRLGRGITKTAANEIVPENIAPPADITPASIAVAPKRRHVAKKIHKKSAAVRKRGKRAKRG